MVVGMAPDFVTSRMEGMKVGQCILWHASEHLAVAATTNKVGCLGAIISKYGSSDFPG